MTGPLHEQLRARRLDLGISQTVLAEGAGVSRPTVARLETGQDISLSNLGKITNALGLSLTLELSKQGV